MPIIPDDKDWTWVLERPCPECGFDASTLPIDQVAVLLRENAASWIALLAGSPELLRSHMSEDRWSPLEYACHVRDVFVRFDGRLESMLTLDAPTFPNWDQDKTAVEERYNEQDPDTVAHQLGRAGERLADAFEAVVGDDWSRSGTRSDGAQFTVASLGRYLIHDPIHHLHDVTVDLEMLGS